ncbi:hypothetical protein D3C80_1972630 [compost metagenome]
MLNSMIDERDGGAEQSLSRSYKTTVGASLLAMAADQSIWKVTDGSLSRASSLPQGDCIPGGQCGSPAYRF